MKKLVPLLCALLGALSAPALPALAQGAEAPSEIGFEFNYNYDGKTRVTAFNVGYKRLLVDAAPVVFDATVIGASGAIESDVLSFFDEKGAVLGTLTSTFDQGGHLKGQALAEGKAPARALNWFETGTQSPVLTLGDSVLTARYSAQAGRVKTRVLSLRLPQGTREITTTYDALGRREHDTGTSKAGPTEVSYAYDKVGLTNLRVELPPEPGKPEPGKTEAKQSIMEMEFARAGDGQVERVTLKRDGVLAIRMVTSFDQQGESTANKAEYFEGGVLQRVVNVNMTDHTTATEEYKNGVISARTTQRTPENEAPQTIAVEAFDAGGKLAQRTDYNTDGLATTITTFNADGSVKETRKLDAGE